MKTIVRKSDNVSLYIYPDNKAITLESNRAVIGTTDNPELYISDLNSSNAEVHTGVDDKSDYWGNKYKHDGTNWSDNSSFIGQNRLSINVDSSINQISVGNTNPFTASGTVQIGDEKITYTGVDGTNLTGCTRGAASTDAASHTSGDSVTQI